MKTRLIVAGGGEGFYKYLWLVVQSKNPDLDMMIAVLIDILPREALHPKTQEIIASEGIIYLRANELEKLNLPAEGNVAGVVMTPNDSHFHYVELFTSMGVPVYAEKPIVTNIKDLKKLLNMPEEKLRYIYGAEPCVDGKALAFLDMAGVIKLFDPRVRYISSSTDRASLYHHHYCQLGNLLSVHGKMLEGEGTAGTADHRQWLLKGSHGGMIRDLVSHLFGPLYEAGLAGSEVADLKVKLGRYEKGMELGMWRPLKSAIEGETYAEIKGKFLMPYGTPDFEFQAGKYWPKHERFLVLTFERGLVKLSYEKPFEVTIETELGRATSKVTADFYPTLSFLRFKDFIKGYTHGYLGRAAAIVRFNEQARRAGLVQLNI